LVITNSECLIEIFLRRNPIQRRVFLYAKGFRMSVLNTIERRISIRIKQRVVDEWDAKEEKQLPNALRIKITLKNNKARRKKFLLTLLASISANRFEEVRATRLRPQDDTANASEVR